MYTEQDHESWRKLYSRMRSPWEKHANQHFLHGVEALKLPPDRIPHLDEVNRFLRPLTGFQAKPVGGYVPAFEFFDYLRNRAFPTTVTIRKPDQLDYLPEPDIFHDIAGHVPMHTDPQFAETLVRFGECAYTAAGMGVDARELRSIVQAMARFFWFTVEFGLMREGGELKAYGSGLLSSFAELPHSLESGEVQRYPIQLEWVIHQSFEIHRFQPLLFVVESFDHLYELVRELEDWMKSGKLSHVAPGEPALSEADLASFAGALAVGKLDR